MRTDTWSANSGRGLAFGGAVLGLLGGNMAASISLPSEPIAGQQLLPSQWIAATSYGNIVDAQGGEYRLSEPDVGAAMREAFLRFASSQKTLDKDIAVALNGSRFKLYAR